MTNNFFIRLTLSAYENCTQSKQPKLININKLVGTHRKFINILDKKNNIYLKLLAKNVLAYILRLNKTIHKKICFLYANSSYCTISKKTTYCVNLWYYLLGSYK